MVLIDETNGSPSESEDEPSILGGTTDETQNGNGRRRRQHTNVRSDDTAELFMIAAKRLWLKVKNVSNFIMIDMGGYQLFDQLAQWCIQHPQAAICLLAIGLVTFLPFLLLVGFGLSTILMTFTGFLVLEGTLFTILSMMLFGLLGALIIVLLFFAVIGVAAYFGFAHIYDLYGNVESHKSAIKRFLQKEEQRFPPQERNSNRTGNSNQEQTN